MTSVHCPKYDPRGEGSVTLKAEGGNVMLGRLVRQTALKQCLVCVSGVMCVLLECSCHARARCHLSPVAAVPALSQSHPPSVNVVSE